MKLGFFPVGGIIRNVFNIVIGNATPAVLTNPIYQTTNSVDNYTQNSCQNKSATANASADNICYPDNVSASDLTGFADIGICSSAFAQAAYAITQANEPYLFGSAPAASGTSGSLIICTDSTGTANDIIFGTGGFDNQNKKRVWVTGGSVGVGIGARAPANAALSVVSTTQAFIPPVMTTTQKNAISVPTPGMVVFDSTLAKLCVRGSAAWETVTSA